MIKDLIQQMEAEASRAVYKMIERALHLSILARNGSIPSPDEITRRGRHIKCSGGELFWDEWQWDTKPLFRLHTKTSEMELRWSIEFFTESGESMGLATWGLPPDTNP